MAACVRVFSCWDSSMEVTLPNSGLSTVHLLHDAAASVSLHAPNCLEGRDFIFPKSVCSRDHLEPHLTCTPVPNIDSCFVFPGHGRQKAGRKSGGYCIWEHFSLEVESAVFGQTSHTLICMTLYTSPISCLQTLETINYLVKLGFWPVKSDRSNGSYWVSAPHNLGHSLDLEPSSRLASLFHRWGDQGSAESRACPGHPALGSGRRDHFKPVPLTSFCRDFYCTASAVEAHMAFFLKQCEHVQKACESTHVQFKEK